MAAELRSFHGMVDRPITIAGIVVPTTNTAFLATLAVHVVAGLLCVVAGAVAMFSRKARGRHPRAGRIYCRSLAVAFATMSLLATMRWAEDWHLFVIGLLSFVSALIGRHFINNTNRRRVRVHIAGMGVSYMLLIIAFYVDNGPTLPLWKHLPSFAYSGLPLLIGIPLIVRSLSAHRSLDSVDRERHGPRLT